MKKIRKFDAGGMASSSPQPAFTQFGATPPAFGSGMVGGMANSTDTGVGGVRAAPAPAMAQAPAMTPTAPTQAMRRGGTVKKFADGGDAAARQIKEGEDIVARITGGYKSPKKTMPAAPSMDYINKRMEEIAKLKDEDMPLGEMGYLHDERKKREYEEFTRQTPKMRRGGVVKKSSMAKKAMKFSKGGAVTSRGDGCCSKGKTKGRVC